LTKKHLSFRPLVEAEPPSQEDASPWWPSRRFPWWATFG
jgi:hypothetical protein